MKELLKPYSKYAKWALGLASIGLVAFGIYDATTAQAVIGAAGAFGVAFWELYDRTIGSK